MTSPFKVTLYSKAFVKLGQVGTWKTLSVTPRHNQQPTASLTVDVGSPRLNDLLTDGVRAVIHYRGTQMMSGPVRSWQAQGPSATADFTFQIADDWWLFQRLLAWPVPTAAGADLDTKLTAQTSEYDTKTGPAETVLKGIVSDNVGRLTPTVTVAPDQGRGGTISLANRFHPLTDRLLPLLDAAGIGVTVKQVGTGLTLDVYTTRTYPRTLSEDSGILQSWTISSAGPKVTRDIVGGKGTGTARVFRSVIDSNLETRFGYAIEGFKDATDLDTIYQLDQRGIDDLATLGPTNGITVTLAETSTFRYDPTRSGGVGVGDIVTLRVAPGVTRTDVLRAATLTDTPAAGLVVTPQVGDLSNDPSLSLAQTVAAFAREARSGTRR